MKKQSLSEALKKLEEISDWFENREEIDVEQALEKVKEGAELIKFGKARLKEVENEFEKVQKELETEE